MVELVTILDIIDVSIVDADEGVISLTDKVSIGAMLLLLLAILECVALLLLAIMLGVALLVLAIMLGVALLLLAIMGGAALLLLAIMVCVPSIDSCIVLLSIPVFTNDVIVSDDNVVMVSGGIDDVISDGDGDADNWLNKLKVFGKVSEVH